MVNNRDGQASNSPIKLPTQAGNTGAPKTAPEPQEQIEDEIEIGPSINGCHNPVKTNLAKGDAMTSIVNDLETSRAQKLDKHYIWGTIANGNVLSAYLKYEWGPQEGDSKNDKELKTAGARWLDKRTPEQKQLLVKCQTLARKFAGDPNREIKEMLFMISEPGSVGQEAHMDMEHNNGDYVVFIMFTKGYKTQWMTTEKELKINSFMDIPTEWSIEEEQQPLEPGDAFALMPSLPHRAPAHPSSNKQRRVVLMIVFASKPSDGRPIFLQEHKDRVQTYREEQEKKEKNNVSQTQPNTVEQKHLECSFGGDGTKKCSFNTTVQGCTNEVCKTKLGSCYTCSVEHSTGTTHTEDDTTNTTARICAGCCACEKCASRRRLPGHAPLGAPHQQENTAATPTDEIKSQEEITSTHDKRMDNDEKTTAPEQECPFSKYEWFQHLRANPQCKWRTFGSNTEGCDTNNCKCPFRVQDIRQMTEVVCDNENSYVELNKSCLTPEFGKTPQAKRAISEWCEKNTEARKVLHNRFKELKSAMNAEDNEKNAFKANPQGWRPPPYEIEQAPTSALAYSDSPDSSGPDDNIDMEEDEYETEKPEGEWHTTKFDAKPSAEGKACMLPWGESKVDDEIWVWRHDQPDEGHTHDEEDESIVVTIVRDTAAMQGTIELDWKEHVLRTGGKEGGLTEAILASNDWLSKEPIKAGVITILGDCLQQKLSKKQNNITVVYESRQNMDERVRTDTKVVKRNNNTHDREIIVDLWLFARGSRRNQYRAFIEGEDDRAMHINEYDVLKTYKEYSDFASRSGTIFIPPLKMALDAAKYHSQPPATCAYVNDQLRRNNWPSRLRVPQRLQVAQDSSEDTLKDFYDVMRRDTTLATSFIHRREYASAQQFSQFAVKNPTVLKAAGKSQFRGTVSMVHKEGSYFRVLFINLQYIRLHQIYARGGGEDVEIHEPDLTTGHRILIEEAREYTRNLDRDVNRIYGYLAQVTIAKTDYEMMEFSVISVDSYPTMTLNEKEPSDMWKMKNTQTAPETKCNERRVGDALAHSVRRMIRDNTPGERERPTTPPQSTETTDADTNKPWIPTLWEDGIRTLIQKAQRAGASKQNKSLTDREEHKIHINGKDSLITGKTDTETPTGENTKVRNKRQRTEKQ